VGRARQDQNWGQCYLIRKARIYDSGQTVSRLNDTQVPRRSANSPTPKKAVVTDGGQLCPLCGGLEVEIWSSAEDKNLTVSDIGPSREMISHGTILRCRICGFGFRMLRPAEEELASLYRELVPRVYENESKGRSKTARRHLRIVNRYAKGQQLLDVGCASGAFLRCAADARWTVVGVEPAAFLCERAKESIGERGTVICAPLQQADLHGSSFDVVTVWDVLEHVPKPIEFLKLCTSLLKPGGYLFANVPDLGSLEARLLGEHWPLLLAEHLNYFDRASLRQCGEQARLKLIKIGRRSASFSMRYVFYRLAQHRVPGAALGHRIVDANFLGRICIPVSLGEIYAVWKSPR
jgi:ubiquinone/menaquinone biosynthesis C-methylase UbiE